jgi:tRNA-2-methylthio-N6-dimethylallyladenosine synthase
MKYNLQVHGCQMNTSDGEKVSTVMDGAGFNKVEDWKNADCVIYVSCSIKQQAEDKIVGAIRENAKRKKENEKIRIGLTGCMVRNSSVRGDELEDGCIKNIPGLDFAFRIEELGKLPEMLGGLYGQEFRGLENAIDSKPGSTFHVQQIATLPTVARNDKMGQAGLLHAIGEHGAMTKSDGVENSELEKDFVQGTAEYFSVQPKSSSSFQGLLPIMNGCNKFCTYCIVPYSRGREVSRPMYDVVESAKQLVESGRRELLLLGQNVNSYGLTNTVFGKGYEGNKRSAFAMLLRELNDIDGVKRIRFTSPHPRDMTEEVIDCVAELSNLSEYLHMPLQSGSDRILKAMNRGYSRDKYLGQIEYIRKRMPRVGLTTDIIVGFCGETLEDHAATREVMEIAKFDIAYISQFSMRTGTYAAKKLTDDVSKAEKKRRFHELNDEVLMRTSLESNERYVGETHEVLVESIEESLADRGQLTAIGRLRTYRQVRVVEKENEKKKKGLNVGDYVMVRITVAREWILEGEVV